MQNDGQPTLTDTCLRPIFIKFWGAAEPLDKNRSRMFQPTLRFLNAIGGKYGNYLRGSYGEGFANSFWRGIGLQRRRGEETHFFRSRKVFQVVIRLQRRRGKEKKMVPKSFQWVIKLQRRREEEKTF